MLQLQVYIHVVHISGEETTTMHAIYTIDSATTYLYTDHVCILICDHDCMESKFYM